MRLRILAAIADPNLALALVIAGMVGIYAECIRPGRIVAGVGGGILLLLGLSAMGKLPINGWGATLFLLAFPLFALEAGFTCRGVAGCLGGVALVWGSRLLVEGSRIHWGTAVGLGLPFSALTVYLMTIAVKARRNKRETTI